MNKFVIYTAIFGNYDEIKQPLVIDYRFDYIIFSNDLKEKKIGVWQVRTFDYYNSDSTRICRYVKTHPEELLFNYDFSVWMDASIQICTMYFYEKVIELYNNNILISSLCHPTRKCIYEEAFAVVNMMVEHEEVVVKWCHYLRREKFPRNVGLCETGVMYRKHNVNIINYLNSLWWNYIDQYSRRDQLSYNYVLWKLSIPCHFIFGEGNNARNTEHLRLVQHKNIKHNHCPIKKNEAWLMRYCWKLPSKTNIISQLYYKLYSYPFPKIWFALYGQLYRLKYLFTQK